MHKFRKANKEDAEFVLKCREADLGEISSLGFTDYVKAMTQSIEISKHCFIVNINEQDHIICGVLDGGIIWAMTTDECMIKHKKEFYKATQRFIKFCFRDYDALGNYIWSKNEKHITFLERFGFTVDVVNCIIIENTGEKFYPFYKIKGE